MEAPRIETAPEPLPLAVARKRSARVVVIGGGGTGAACAYDLALRGFDVTLLEKGELTSGTTGRHHGQLHCGARYAWADAEIARECYRESLILERIAPDCIEYNGGLFVGLRGEDPSLGAEFMDRCADAGIPATAISPAAARLMEPALSESVCSAVAVPDGSFDAFRLPLQFFAAARTLGAKILPWHEVVGIEASSGRIRAVHAIKTAGASLDEDQAADLRFECDYCVNAAGAWADRIAALAGGIAPVTPAAGAMLAVKGRIVSRVISRLRPPGDGDILVPQRGLSIIGSTQRRASSPDGLIPLKDEKAFLLSAASLLAPEFEKLPFHAVWAAARPLFGNSKAGEIDGRHLSRDFRVIDHGSREYGSKRIEGFATIVGGKATVLRAMGEKVADTVCASMALSVACETHRYRLPSWRDFYRTPIR